MPLLSQCWLIVTVFLIPQGSLKWRTLHFFFFPLWLVPCQVVVWVKLLANWLPCIVVVPLKLMSGMIVADARFLLSFFSSHRRDVIDHEASSAAESIKLCALSKDEDFDTYGPLQLAICSHSLRSFPTINEPKTTEEDCRAIVVQEEELYCKTEFADTHNVCPVIDVPNSIDGMKESFQMSDPKLVVSLSEPEAQQQKEEQMDEFYREYATRMTMFDLLNSERGSMLSAILGKQVQDSNLAERFASITSASDTHGNVGMRKLVRRLQCEFERVYVGHSCLCWDAIHHQYLKIQQMAAADCHLRLPYDRVAQKFQKFRVLLERFMEDEGPQIERFWRYSKSRLASKNLLQVPCLSGYAEEEQIGGGDVKATKLLQIMEESIWTFWVLLSTDNKKTPRRLGSKLLWDDPLVEDPNDLELLFYLRKTLKERKARAKDMVRKKKGWLLKRRRMDTVEEAQKLEYLFALIEIKLVSRVLKMSHLSTSQLNWCQHKLQGIEFHGGKLYRGCSGFFFPFS
ncbi:uncharacterized protein LOC116248783 [Nymphaea colorata]|nr:uncharacterized protein LOC116248783 [Nymphaea colorata]